MSGFTRRAEKKREDIKQAALELYRVYGFEKVTMDDIARKARVSKVTIYKHFGSKEDLVNVVVKEVFLGVSEGLRKIIRGNMPFPDKLEAAIFKKTEIVNEYDTELLNIVKQGHPELKQFIRTLWREEVNQLTLELFEEGKRLGFVDKNITLDIIQTYIELLMEGQFASTGLLEKKLKDDQSVRALVHVILYGLMGESKDTSL